MADETAPAPADEQPPVPEAPEAPLTADPAPTPEAAAEPAAPAEPPQDAPEPTRADTIAALIRTGLSNSAISRDDLSWQALETLLPEIVAAIIKEA